MADTSAAWSCSPHSTTLLKSLKGVTLTQSVLSANQTFCNKFYLDSLLFNWALWPLYLIKKNPKTLSVSHLAHFCRSFSQVGIQFMLSLPANFANDIPTRFFHSFTHKMQELLECSKGYTGLLLKKALCSLIWLQDQACDRVVGGTRGLGCSIPSRSGVFPCWLHSAPHCLCCVHKGRMCNCPEVPGRSATCSWPW